MKIRYTVLSALMILSAVATNGCNKLPGAKEHEKSYTVSVSIPPAAYLIEQITQGTDIKVQTILKPGEDPHTASVDAKQIVKLNNSDIFFTVGLPEEEQYTNALKNSETTRISNLDRLTKKRAISQRSNCCPHGKGDDPHTWLSLNNLRLMSISATAELCAVYPDKKNIFKANFLKLEKKIFKLRSKLIVKLLPYAGTTLYVYHPSFGYFADEFGLNQRAIEFEGKTPTIKHLDKTLALAESDKAKAVITQPQSNPSYARIIARKIDAKVYSVDPLAANPLNTIKKLADIVVKSAEE